MLLPESDDIAYDYRSFAVVTTDGLKLICGVYKHRDQYWMTVQLKTTIMPTAEAASYAKENSFRYDGWYFYWPVRTEAVYIKVWPEISPGRRQNRLPFVTAAGNTRLSVSSYIRCANTFASRCIFPWWWHRKNRNGCDSC